jgi:hypothetical protein
LGLANPNTSGTQQGQRIHCRGTWGRQDRNEGFSSKHPTLTGRTSGLGLCTDHWVILYANLLWFMISWKHAMIFPRKMHKPLYICNFEFTNSSDAIHASFFFFLETGSCYGAPRWPPAHTPSASASRGLGLQAYTTISIVLEI